MDGAGLIGEICGAVLAPERWPATLEHLGDAFGGSSVLFGIENRLGDANFAAMARVDDDYLRRYRQVYADPCRNIVARKLLSMPVGMALVGTDWEEREAFIRSEPYNELMRPQGLQDGAMALLARDDDHFVPLSIMRPDRVEPFGDRERRLLALLVPHLQRASQMMLRLGVLHTRLASLEDAVDRLPLGVALVGSGGKVLHLNRLALAIVTAHDGLWQAGDGLAAAKASKTRELHRLVAEAAAGGNGRGTGGGMALSRPSGAAPLSVLVSPLGRDRPVESYRMPAAIVFISDPEQEGASPPELLRRLYGLTRAEAALAALLLQGKELAQAAEELQVSLNTVCTQLKSLFDKTGVRRQAELVRLLLRGPAGLLAS